MNTLELAKANPEAYAALPEPYQADDCLTFYEEGGYLCCEPASGQHEALGNWVATYDPNTHEWVFDK